MAAFLAVAFYAGSVIAGYLVELAFGLAHLVPTTRNARVDTASVSWNYTTFLNIAFLLLAVVLVVRFLRTGGPAMMAMMGGSPDDMSGHDHGGQDMSGDGHPGHGEPSRPGHVDPAGHDHAHDCAHDQAFDHAHDHAHDQALDHGGHPGPGR